MRLIKFQTLFISFLLIFSTSANEWLEYFGKKNCSYVNIGQPSSIIRCMNGGLNSFESSFPRNKINKSDFWEINLNNNRIHNLEFLSGVSVISNSFESEGNMLIHVDGLNGLKVVGRTLNLSNNPLLDISGLSNIEYAQSIYISNTGIKDVDSFYKIEYLDNNLYLNNNQLIDISGLSNIYYIGGNLKLNQNNLRDVDGLIGLRRVSVLDLRGNPALFDLAGLSNLVSVDYILIDNRVYREWPRKGSSFCENKLYKRMSLSGNGYIRDNYPIVRKAMLFCMF